MSTCLSDFALDNLLLGGPDTQAAAAHLSGCEACRRRRDQRLLQFEDFERDQAPSFWREVRRRHEQRPQAHWRLRFALPGAVVIAGVALLLLAPRLHLNDAGRATYRAAKGGAYLQLHCRRAGRAFSLSPEDSVRPGDELRFVPHPVAADAGYVQVASIDGTGRYAPFYPPAGQGQSVPLPPSGQPLDGSIRLDAAPGPERLFFVFSPRPLPVAAVQQAAQARLGGLQPTGVIDGVPVESGWIVLSKVGAGEAR